MKFTTNKYEKYTVVAIEEEKFDSTLAVEAKSIFVEVFQSGSVNLIVDMSKVKYVDSSGLSAILVAQRLAQNSNGLLVLFAVTDHVLKLIKISKLDAVLNILSTYEEAVDAVFMSEIEREIKEDEA
jgi:anti-anti-sigma factor